MWTDTIDRYLTSLRAAGRAAGTVRLHGHYLGLLARAHADPWAVTRGDLEQWLAGSSWRPETRRSARSTVACFYRWAVSVGYLLRSPAADLLPVKIPRAMPRPAPEAAFDQAMANAPWRVRVMLALARYAGLRCVEICAVHSRDLVGDLLYVRGKGGHQRTVPVVSPELIAVIHAARGYVFPGGDGGHLSPRWVSEIMGRYLPDGWTAHTLRHAFATRAYANNPDLLALAEVMGHANIATTRRYAAVPEGALRAVVEAAAGARERPVLAPPLRRVA